MISACCLNADEARTGIVDSLSPEIVNLLARCAQAAFERLPRIQQWRITTFGPDDYNWLEEIGISKVLLPYMWDAPRSKVREDMEKNFALTGEMVSVLASLLPFPVTLAQLSDLNDSLDIPWLVSESRERANLMLPSLEREPPLIFRQLKTRQERFDRVQQEAFLYLLDTIRFGQLHGENRPAILYVGLEVHGGYWAHGNLFQGPRGEFLPLAWLPQCVRQHWGGWVLKNPQLNKERKQLSALLARLGH